MSKINLIMPFPRAHLKDTLIEYYEPMGITIHQIMFESETYIDFDREWVKPIFVPGDLPGPSEILPVVAVNYFIETHKFADDDYYVTTPDDDMYAPGVLDAIKEMDDDIVIISMDRGDRTHHVRTLYADPGYMQVGLVGGEQVFIKGSIFKGLHFENQTCTDGIMVEALKEKYDFRYEPELRVFFNYLNPEWWTEQP